MWNRRWWFWTEVFFWGSVAQKEKNAEVQSYYCHHNRSLGILMHVKCNLWRNTLWSLFLTYCLPFPVREFRSGQARRSSRNVINAVVRSTKYTHLFGIESEDALCAYDITFAGHEKSLCSDNDLRCHWRKMKIKSLDCTITQVNSTE